MLGSTIISNLSQGNYSQGWRNFDFGIKIIPEKSEALITFLTN